MKKSPQTEKLEEMLRSSKLVAGGFMGDDTRSIFEIIDSDTAEIFRLGFTTARIAERMQEITTAAIPQLGNWIDLDKSRQAKVDEAKGSLVCPWPHPGKFAKRVTTLRLTDTGQTIKWSDLNIHLIAEHGFFEGKGSEFRIDPKELISFIF